MGTIGGTQNSGDRQTREIDSGADYLGFRQAFNLVRENCLRIGSKDIALEASLHYVAAEDIGAAVDCPLADISLKDGYAVLSSDIAAAACHHPVLLEIMGSAYAGTEFSGALSPGQAAQVCSGALIPAGANAVIASEFCEEVSGRQLRVCADAAEGRNILRSGEEVKRGAILIHKEDFITPELMGLACAGGIGKVRVFRRPKVAIIAIGDEIAAPGGRLDSGQVYASNLVTLKAWLQCFDIECTTSLVKDNVQAIRTELVKQHTAADAILTSGGAWGSARDLIVGVLSGLGWREIFHHVRMGPGKGISFGLWEDRPVFCLPGGPASNETAFLQLALPGIVRMAGIERHPLPSVPAVLMEEIKGRNQSWTEFRRCVLSGTDNEGYRVSVFKDRSRLQSIARTSALLCLPEGRDTLSRGEHISVQVLAPLSWQPVV